MRGQQTTNTKQRLFRLLALLGGLSLAAPAAAQGRVVDARFVSPALGAAKDVVVYLPPSYAAGGARRYPVLYYLHGMWGSERDWTRAGRLAAVMDSLVRRGAAEAIVVMPDGDDGWYTTWNVLAALSGCAARVPATEPAERYCVPWARYDEYVARDLVAWVDSTYRTLPARAHRGVGGLSMGGYGAVALAAAYPDVFSAAASHSGALAPLRTLAAATTPARPTPAELERGWGPRFWPYLRPAFGRDTAGWWARDPARLVRRLHAAAPARTPALYVDVGTGDPFLAQNRAFRDSLTAMRVDHVYGEAPGGHDWAYWRARLGVGLAWLLRQVAPAAGP